MHQDELRLDFNLNEWYSNQEGGISRKEIINEKYLLTVTAVVKLCDMSGNTANPRVKKPSLNKGVSLLNNMFFCYISPEKRVG